METSNKTTSQDPRIDSPEIRVVYPADPVVLPRKETTTQTAANPLPMADSAEPTSALGAVNSAPTTTQQPTNTMSVVDAIKQHFLVFSLMGFCLMAFGYLIAKNK